MANTRLAKIVLTIKGVWSPTVKYEKLDLVNYLGSSYIARRDNIGVTPVEGDDWSLSAEKGDKGDQGDKIYLHIAYANSEDGETDFTTSPVSGKVYTYLGSYSDYTPEYPNVPSMYVWSKLSEEAARAAAELLRVAAEEERVAAETTRVSAESQRDKAESDRNIAELDRALNESGRKTAETSRVSAENTRDTSETKRVNAEISRATAETDRVNAEQVRVTAESGRVSAEQGRVSAETERAEIFRGYQDEIAQFKNDIVTSKDAATENTRFAIGKSEESLEIPSMQEFNELKDDLADVGNFIYKGTTNAHYVHIYSNFSVVSGDKVYLDVQQFVTGAEYNLFGWNNGTSISIAHNLSGHRNEIDISANYERISVAYTNASEQSIEYVLFLVKYNAPSMGNYLIKLLKSNLDNAGAIDDLNSYVENHETRLLSVEGKLGGGAITESVTDQQIFADCFVKSDGQTSQTASNWHCTDYISLDAFNIAQSKTLTVRCWIFGNASFCVYDRDKKLLFSINGNNAADYGLSGNQFAQEFSVDVPLNSMYIRMSAYNGYTDASDLWVKGIGYGEIDIEINDLKNIVKNIPTSFADAKVLVIGDSISTDQYGNYKKWVTYLCDSNYFDESKVTNSSQHATGFVATSNGSYPSFITRLEEIPSKETYDAVIVYGGINDYIQSIPMGDSGGDKLTQFVPAVEYFFQFLMRNFTQARICVFTPMKNYNANNANAVGLYISDYVNAIKKECSKYALPILDLFADSGFSPELWYFKDMWTLIPSGYTDADGVHPNTQWIVSRMVPQIKHFLDGML